MLNESYDAIRVCDFGSALYEDESIITSELVSRYYRAPEIILGIKPNTKIDIWSLGVIMFYLISGGLPFDDKSDNEEAIAKKIVYKMVKFKSPTWDDKSKEAIALIKKCLIKSPEERIGIDNFVSDPWIVKGKEYCPC